MKYCIYVYCQSLSFGPWIATVLRLYFGLLPVCTAKTVPRPSISRSQLVPESFERCSIFVSFSGIPLINLTPFKLKLINCCCLLKSCRRHQHRCQISWEKRLCRQFIFALLRRLNAERSSSKRTKTNPVAVGMEGGRDETNPKWGPAEKEFVKRFVKLQGGRKLLLFSLLGREVKELVAREGARRRLRNWFPFFLLSWLLICWCLACRGRVWWELEAFQKCFFLFDPIYNLAFIFSSFCF